MEHQTTLGRSNLRVPRMGVGAMTWGDAKGLARFHPAKTAYGGAHGYEEEKRALEVSIEAGVNLFDTAAMYSLGAAERRLGELARGRDVIIATKYPSGFSFRVEDFPKELEATLARLGRDSIDLYQHHYPNERISIPALMNQVADAVERGKVRAVGVSNYSAGQMREAHEALAKRGIPLASNQVEYSLLHRKPEVDGTLDACRELGITLIAYSPLAGGRLTGKYSAQRRPGGFFRRILPQYSRKAMEAIQPVIKLLGGIGEKYGKTPSQVAIRWLIENPLVLPIPGAKNGKQAMDNAQALTFSLTAEEVDALSQAAMA
ncbi:MAG: aldo/keto reductase [Chloroflexi bacterium]|nr:aldo/keto reductase [Chloroflexota bacterium]MDL1944002.1 aldo/keto reductase [Chloroflexi bacterium CFX2]